MSSYTNILCAIDLSPGSDATCARAIEMARNHEAKLTLLYVVEHFPQDRSNEFIAPEYTDPAKYHESKARNGLTALAERLGYSEARQEVRFSTSSAWHEIVRCAKDQAADLIVLGSHGAYGIFAFLGSTANSTVNHAPCDVLAVRALA